MGLGRNLGRAPSFLLWVPGCFFGDRMPIYKINMQWFSTGSDPDDALQNLLMDLHRNGMRIDSTVTYRKVSDDDVMVQVSKSIS